MAWGKGGLVCPVLHKAMSYPSWLLTPGTPYLNHNLASELCLQPEMELSSFFCWDKLVSEERSPFLTEEIRPLSQKTVVT